MTFSKKLNLSNNLTNPFIKRHFLDALSESNSACADTGWDPLHIRINQGNAGAMLPLYLKTHSMGEYVFDHPWANAYHRHGLEYYPKLVTAIPFTPSMGPRIVSPDNSLPINYTELINNITEIATNRRLSSWHLLFGNTHVVRSFESPELLTRKGVQYHWHNRGYSDFDDFLNSLTSKKRKMIRKERESISRQEIAVTLLTGKKIGNSVWELFYNLYERTYAKRNGTRGYLTKKFFNLISSSMSDQLLMAVATRHEKPIACALYFYDSECLYGRYWGSTSEYDHLHFELCYYAGIEFAITNGLVRFDAGAQGEHKLIRGFEPVETTSLHWIRSPEFRHAISSFLEQEEPHVVEHMERARQLLPYKST
ncbi:MAG: GNAT family N-acetyltransferase [Cellvibrionales bacterium TMED49]|nr:GNAT family N-acetyltransferase [Porticoccaceae bacterium]OUU37002.1 MAG: GNAT family N-acetyltransferase [Cellvibrionales bacterium TMED49]